MTPQRILTKQGILADAVGALRRIPGVRLRHVAVNWEPRKKPGRFDAEIDIRLGHRRERFLVEVKEFLRGKEALAWIREARWRAEQAGQAFLLVTRYCPDPTAERLAAEGINFLDTVGNVNLRAGNLVVFVTGRKAPRGFAEGTAEGPLATPGGLRIIYVTLTEPEREWKVQELATAAGHPVGWTHTIVRGLERTGLVRRTRPRGPIVVMNYEKLLARWIADYPVVLRPKLELGRFAPIGKGAPLEILDEPPNLMITPETQTKRAHRPPNLVGAEIVPLTIDAVANRVKAAAGPGRHLALGGTWGADALVRFYRGPRLVLHADPPARAWVRPLRIVPDDRGPITLLAPVAPAMWMHVLQTRAGPVAPPLVLYAELRTDPDPRAQELAAELARKFPRVLGGH
jgi:hypothetical protein